MEPAVRLSEVVASLSYALDLTEGLPEGHAVRTCVVGMRLAEVLGLPEADRSSLFYALLLKDAGCSTNAAPVAELFGHDDRAVKADKKTIDEDSPREMLAYLVRNARPGASPVARAAQLVQMARLARRGAASQASLVALRCERGADIAQMLGLGTATADAIASMHEHWDGKGFPGGLEGERIPLLGRIVALAQTVEVFHAAGGPDAAIGVAEHRRGRWFDPRLVDALVQLGPHDRLWRLLRNADGEAVLARLEPRDRVEVATPDRLDRLAEAFARVIDAKSPFTARHSSGVADFAVAIAAELGLDAEQRRDLRHAGLLHDIGKLGVSNTILDKPGKLDQAEWEAVKRHPVLTWKILRGVSAFRPIATMAAAHHERLDGSGYQLGLRGDGLRLPARILAVADVAEALGAERPYRDALGPDEVLAIIRRDVPHRLDARAFEALEAVLGRPAEQRFGTLAA